VGGRNIAQQEIIARAKILFQNPNNCSLGMFKDSTIILDAIRLSLFNKSAATSAMFTSVRVDFGRPPCHFLPVPFRLEIVNTT
jgi:hypothetical protein